MAHKIDKQTWLQLKASKDDQTYSLPSMGATNFGIINQPKVAPANQLRPQIETAH